MSRLPKVGADQGNWGAILNDFLSQTHKSDGTLRDGIVTSSKLAAGVLSAVAISGSYADLSGKPSIPSSPSDIGAEPAGLSPATITTISNNNDTVTAANISNPETQSATAVTNLVTQTFNGFSPLSSGKFVTLFTGANINTPRPLLTNGGVWPGPVIWSSQIGRPTNMLAGTDFYFAISLDPLSFNPLSLAGLFGWYDPSNTGVTSGATMTTFPDRSPSGNALVNWVVSSGSGATNLPMYVATGMGGTPCVTLTPRSGFFGTLNISSPACVVLGMNLNWTGTVPSSTSQTANSLGGSDAGKYSIARTQAGTWAFTVDGLTIYNFGTADTSPHSFVAVVTPIKAQVYIDGTLSLDQTIAISPLPTISTFRLGYVAASSTNSTWKYMNGGSVGDAFGATPAIAPATADITTYSSWLKGRRGAS